MCEGGQLLGSCAALLLFGLGGARTSAGAWDNCPTMSDFDPTDLELEDTIAEGQKAAAMRQQQFEINDLQWLMGNKRGRRIVWRLLEQAGVHRLSFEPSSDSVTAFREGQRNFGLRLLALVQGHCSEGYVTMLQERLNDRYADHR